MGPIRSGMLTGMDERSRILLATLLGSALGGVVGYLYMTEDGRRLRDQIEPTLDSIVTELAHARETGEKVREVVREGRRTLDDLIGGDRTRTAWEPSDFDRVSS